MGKPKTIIVDGVTYYSTKPEVEKLDGMEYKIVRCDRAGVFAGYIESEDGSTVVMREARRLWYWDGAASLSQLAMEGVKKPENCKFPIPVKKVKLFNVIEILEVTVEAKNSIDEVEIWKQ